MTQQATARYLFLTSKSKKPVMSPPQAVCDVVSATLPRTSSTYMIYIEKVKIIQSKDPFVTLRLTCGRYLQTRHNQDFGSSALYRKDFA